MITQVRFIGYWNAFYVSDCEWQNPSMWDVEFRRRLHWIGTPRWHYSAECKALYRYLADRVDLKTFWDNGSWINVDVPITRNLLEAA